METDWPSSGYRAPRRILPSARIDGFKIGVWVAGLVLPWSGVLLVLRFALTASG